ncbi:PAS domain S-box protein [Rhodoferax saidenbachensis]|nr:PAS domain S-box protein [Rhodoferax saidenbachensis]
MPKKVNAAHSRSGPAPTALAALLLVVGLVLTGLAVQKRSASLREESLRNFSLQLERLDASVRAQFGQPLLGLQGLKALLAANGQLEGKAFRAWVTAHNLSEDYPGARGFGFMERVPRNQRDRYVTTQRKNQSSTFSIWSQGDTSDLYVVKYIEPLERNMPLWGWDASSDTTLREAIERVTLTGEPALTRPQTVDGEKPWEGDYLYLAPLFKHGAPAHTVAERQAAFLGVVFAPIVLEELLLPTLFITDGVADFELLDAPQQGQSTLTFSSHNAVYGDTSNRTPTDFSDREFHNSKTLVIGGRRLILEGASNSTFESGMDRRTPAIIGIVGTLLSALLSLIFWMALVGRARAQALAESMTRDLARLAHVVRSTSHVVMVFDLQRNIVWVNEAFTRVSGIAAADALGRSFDSLFGMEHNPPEFLTQSRAAQERGENLRMQVPWKLANGETLWFDVDFQAEFDVDQRVCGYVAVAANITSQQRASEQLANALRENQALMEALDQHSIVSIADHRGTITYVNDMFCRISGYSREELMGGNHRLVKSRQQPDAFWEQMWKTIASGYTWRATVCNQAKDGRLYWVDTVIAPFFDDAGNIEKYVSIRSDVTPAHKAQADLANERTHLIAILEGTSAGTWEWEVPSNRILVNARLVEMLGYTLEELGPLSMDTWMQFCHPDDVAHTRATLAQHIHGQLESFESEVRMRHRDGRWIWIQIRGKVSTRTASGKPHWVSGIHLDVSRQKQLQADLHKSNRMMQSILDNIPMALSVFDGDLNLAASNAEFARLLDFPDWLFAGPVTTFESIIRYNASRGEYGTGDLEHAIQAVVERARHTEKHQFERIRPNGLALEVRGAPMPDGGFVTTYADISERKRSEAEVARTTAMLQSVLDSASEVSVIAVNMEGVITLFNKGAERLLGYSAEEVINKQRPEIFFDPAELQARNAALALQLGSPLQGMQALIDDSTLGKRMEWTYIRKDGHRFSVGLVVTAMLDAWGQRIGYLGVSFNITKEKNAQLVLRAAMETAEQAAMAKGQFLANMSHEIRTPMNAILGMLKLLYSTPLDIRQKDYVSKTERAARSLMELLNDILDFSKVEAGKMQLDPQPFVLDDLMRDLSVILSANAGGKDIEVLYDLDPALPATLVGDSMRLQQVLTNLGGNAIKFTEHGEVVVSVTLESLQDGQARLCFTVRDSGIGIAPDKQKLIFTGFSQAEASTTRRFGGTGLGLSICKRLVEMMGGELRVRSALGEGSSFHFSINLPIDSAPSDAMLAPDPPPSPAMAVLLVDNNATARETIARTAQALHWVVDTAGSGAEALQRIQTRTTQGQTGYSAILVDWDMAEMGGEETAQRIRDQCPTPPPIVFLVTAHAQEILAENRGNNQVGLDNVLVKPFTTSMLREAFHDACERLTHPSGTWGKKSATRPQSLLGMRLLVVEDNQINQQVAKELLRAEGAIITLAGNGQLGVDAVAQAKPPFDAVLMDIQMPVMDGYTATVAIRKTLGLQDLPIIAMTANATRADREACLAAGMNDHIGKPFDLPKLIAVLQRHTGHITPASSPADTTQAVEPAPADPGDTTYDVAGAIARLDGNTALYRHILHTFLQDVARVPDQLDDLLQRDAYVDATRAVHTTKGLALTVGALPLAAACRGAEQAIKTSAKTLPRWQAEVRNAVADALETLQRVHADMASTTEPPWPASNAVLDRAALVHSLRALQDLLRQSDLQALDAMAALMLAQDGATQRTLAPLQSSVAALDFAQAVVQCDALLAQFSPETHHDGL